MSSKYFGIKPDWSPTEDTGLSFLEIHSKQEIRDSFTEQYGAFEEDEHGCITAPGEDFPCDLGDTDEQLAVLSLTAAFTISTEHEETE